MNKNPENFPKTPYTDNSFKTFEIIIKNYTEELTKIFNSQENSKLSQNDMIVIDNLLKEINEYSNTLLAEHLMEESKKILDYGLELIELLIKVLGKKNKENIYYPLSMKMALLESYFHLLFQHMKNYDESEKLLKEIMSLGEYINVPTFNKASTKFYYGIIKLFQNDVDNAEKFAKEALDLLEKSEDNEEDNQVAGSQALNADSAESNSSKKISKISNILEFLAEIYQVKKVPHKVIQCYEKAYYLNLGRRGVQNVYTDYFKTKLDMFKHDVDDYKPSSPEAVYGNAGTQQPGFDIYNRTSPENSAPLSYTKKNTMTIHKGTADSFSFKIPTTVLYEPLIVSVYKLSNKESNRFDPEFFFSNLCFDKTYLLNFLGEGFSDNSFFYSDDNLNKILSNISLVNGYVSFLDQRLFDALIKTNNKNKIKK